MWCCCLLDLVFAYMCVMCCCSLFGVVAECCFARVVGLCYVCLALWCFRYELCGNAIRCDALSVCVDVAALRVM